MKSLGAWLKKTREGNGITQEAATRAAGCTLRTWQRWEGKGSDWTLGLFRRAALAAGATKAEADAAFMRIEMGLADGGQ